MALGEFQLIERFFRQPALQGAGDVSRIALGIGDDAAMLAPAPHKQLVISTDSLVEGVHFPADHQAADVGYRALAVAVSDLAAMGAMPIGFTLALTLPQADEAWLAGFAEGLASAAGDHRIALIGGDTTRGPLNINVTVFGEVEARRVVRRSDAKPGDLLCVGGSLGDAGAALALLQGQPAPAALDPAGRDYLLQRYWRPQAQCELGLELAGVASAAIDLSDGLLADAAQLARASGVALHLRSSELPCSAALAHWPEAQRRQWMLGAGDDYRLLFCLPPASERCLKVWASQGFEVSVIGDMQAGDGVWLDQQRIEQPHGYQHFTESRHD